MCASVLKSGWSTLTSMLISPFSAWCLNRMTYADQPEPKSYQCVPPWTDSKLFVSKGIHTPHSLGMDRAAVVIVSHIDDGITLCAQSDVCYKVQTFVGHLNSLQIIFIAVWPWEGISFITWTQSDFQWSYTNRKIYDLLASVFSMFSARCLFSLYHWPQNCDATSNLYSYIAFYSLLAS